MDAKGDHHHPEGLTCPLCLEAFKDPTLLRCGHTFCKACLQDYDEQHNDRDYMQCPVCRKRTKLGEERIAGLAPNFSLRGLQDELHVGVVVDDNLSKFCALHRKESKNIFCEVCEDFICITCFIENGHQGHKIIKKEKVLEKLKKRKADLLQRSETRKMEARKFVDKAEKQREDLQCHLTRLERSIKETFARKVSILQENEQRLIAEVGILRNESDGELGSCIAKEEQMLEKIDSFDMVCTGSPAKYVDANILSKHIHMCDDFDSALRKTSNTESLEQYLEAAMNAQFFPADEQQLGIGHIEFGSMVSINKQSASVNCHMESPTVCMKPDPKPSTSARSPEKSAISQNKRRSSGEAMSIPASVRNNSPNIIKNVDLGDRMAGMSALGHDAVVVGFEKQKGSECFFVSGKKKPHLHERVGTVRDIAVLKDGSCVASHGSSTCQFYDAQGCIVSGKQFKCPTRGASYLKICSNQNDTIYSVCGNPGIYVFDGCGGSREMDVLETKGANKPRQICVTKSGDVITSTFATPPNTVDVLHAKGSVSRIRSSTEYLFAAVDDEDRLLVARVMSMSSVLRLTRYTIGKSTIRKEKLFESIVLPHRIENERFWCYVTSLAPNLLAFANTNHLYFISLPD